MSSFNLMKNKLQKQKFKHFNDQNYTKIKKALITLTFEDYLFPPSKQSLGSEQFIRSFENIEWKRPQQSFLPAAQFCLRPLTVTKVATKIGNWNVAFALAVISSQRKLWKQVVRHAPAEEISSQGIYQFRLWYGDWYKVVVDDFLPCSDDNLVFGQSSDSPCVLWVPLLEKALAKLVGSYELIQHLDLCSVMTLLTGATVWSRRLGADSRKAVGDTLFSSRLGLACAQVTPASAPRSESGLAPQHGYLLSAVTELKPPRATQNLRMIKLRALWGSILAEERNQWCYSADFLSRRLSSCTLWSVMDARTRAKMGLAVKDDDELWMTLEDFCLQFEQLFTFHFFSHPWLPNVQRGFNYTMEGRWQRGAALADRAGGSPRCRTFLLNPQYRFDVRQGPQELWVFLLQPDPTPDLMEIGVFLTKVEKNRKFRIHTMQEPLLTSQYLPLRSFTHYLTLDKGRYVLVPGTKKPNTIGRYILRFSSLQPMKVRELMDDKPSKVKGFLRRSVPLLVTTLTILTMTGMKSVASPMVEVSCEGQKSTTDVVRNTLDPQWNVRMVFYHKPKAVIRFRLLYKGICRDGELGRGQLVACATQEEEVFNLPLEVRPSHPPMTLLLRLRTQSDPTLA